LAEREIVGASEVTLVPAGRATKIVWVVLLIVPDTPPSLNEVIFFIELSATVSTVTVTLYVCVLPSSAVTV
jgi:hypothetical protein